MSFLSVIEETSSALQVVWNIAVKLKDSRKEIAAVEKSIRRVRDVLALLKSRMQNRNSAFSKADTKIISMLEEDMKDINEGVDEAQEILEQRDKIPWYELGSKVVWILYQVPNLKLITLSFDSSTTNIHKVMAFIQIDAQDGAKNRDKKREAQVDKLIKAQKDAKQWHENELRKLDMRSKLCQQKGPKAVEDAAIHPGSEKPKAWVQELVAGGMKKSEAQKAVDGILNDIREEHKGRPAEIKRAATFRSEKEAKETKATVEQVKAPKPKARPDTSKRRILIVDASNGPRSIMSQIYLEFLRAWTMNTEKYWLFERVQTADALIPTTFSTPHLPEATDFTPKKGISPDKDIIAAIAGEDSYFWTDSDPNEKTAILKRAQAQKSKGLVESDFVDYDHIICFDLVTQNFLNELRNLVAQEQEKKGKPKQLKSTIHYLKGCPWASKQRDAKARKEYLQQVCGKVKYAVREHFLKKELAWEKPELSISRGEWRTLQVVVKKEMLKVKVKKGKGDAESDVRIGSDKWWKEWRGVVGRVDKKFGCVVHLELKGETLVSVSGPRDKLKEARKMILDE